MIPNTEIPAGLDTSFLRETRSMTEPAIRREGNLIVIPVFVRATTAGDATEYRYFEVPAKYTGQDLTDYGKCLLQSYAAIRHFFYGDWAVQNEMILKGTFARHQFAVKAAFPKAPGEVIPAAERFTAIRTRFWALIDEACAAVGKTRADLPESFNAEEMLAFAVENGMAADAVADYTAKFSIISLNLLQNGRNWDELFA
ncbi:MAG: hypothetical protein IJU70_06460 [Lentisphaeria bacterium]|nr:hypothetical protein [Lentisphaeria bacterium]